MEQQLDLGQALLVASSSGARKRAPSPFVVLASGITRFSPDARYHPKAAWQC
jgi:hypothetical protein